MNNYAHPAITRNSVSTVAIIAGLICFLVYLRALSCGFVNFDDQDYVLNNVMIRRLDVDFLRWAFTTSYIDWWIPFTWISFALDYHFWGLNPLGYHLTNVLLHSVNAGLVVLITDRLLREMSVERRGTADDGRGMRGEGQTFSTLNSQRSSWVILLLAGLLWGIHPLRVEAVVWVTARKDVLNGVFSLASIFFYLEYLHHNVAGSQNPNYKKIYWIALLLFYCSLLAKPSSVVLPIFLLIADFYPFNRLRKGNFMPVLLEKIPFFVASFGIAVATVLSAAQNNNIAAVISLGQKVVISGNAVFEYLRLMVLPLGIIPLYFIPAPIPDAYTVKAAVVLIVCITVLIFYKKKALVAVWFYYLAALLPVIGFVQVGTQAFAARFTYLPAVVPSIAFAALMGYLHGKSADRLPKRFRWIVSILVIAAILFSYLLVTEKLIGTWKDSGRLWTRQIAYLPFDRAYFYRGLFSVDNGTPEAAIADYTAALNLLAREQSPELFNLYAFRGEALIKSGRYAEAVNDLTVAISMYPHPLYYSQRATAFQALGKASEAAEDFKKAGEAHGQMYWFNADMESHQLPKPNKQ